MTDESTQENTIKFLPFHTINDFMRADFRLIVLRKTLGALSTLPDGQRAALNRITRKYVKVPGFRNSEKAPAAVKLLPLSNAFEKQAEVVGAVLAAWAEAQAGLCERVSEVLKERGWFFFPEMNNLSDLPSLKTEKDWGVLPLQADRTRLPGFLIYWPKGQEFEALYQTYESMYPQAEGSIDEVSLMVVWLSMRLPYQVVEDEQPAHEYAAQAEQPVEKAGEQPGDEPPAA